MAQVCRCPGACQHGFWCRPDRILALVCTVLGASLRKVSRPAPGKCIMWPLVAQACEETANQRQDCLRPAPRTAQTGAKSVTDLRHGRGELSLAGWGRRCGRGRGPWRCPIVLEWPQTCAKSASDLHQEWLKPAPRVSQTCAADGEEGRSPPQDHVRALLEGSLRRRRGGMMGCRRSLWKAVQTRERKEGR